MATTPFSRRLRLAPLALTALLAMPLAAQEKGFTPQDVAKLRRVTEAVLSPDGTQVAYVLEVPRNPFKEEDGPAWGELHVVDLEGHTRPFVTGNTHVCKIAWTPDGRGISFLTECKTDEQGELRVIPVDGGEAQAVLRFEADIKEYDWSPDGQRIVFLAKEPLPKKQKELKKKGFKQKIYEEAERLVRVWLADREGEAKPKVLELPGSASELHWSPDGVHLAVALAPTALIDDHYMKRKLHVVDASTGEVVLRFDNPGKLGPLAWSAEGQQLAFISAADLNDPMQGRLMVASLESGEFRDVLPGYQGHVSKLAWQNAETVMFLGDQGVWTTLNEVRADGRARKTIVPIGGPILTSLSLAGDGQSSAFLAHAPQHPPEVYYMAHGDRWPRRLTQSNPWLAERRLAEQEVVTYQARDGLKLEGILIRPLEARRGRRYPLIVSVHGGPEARRANGWLTSYSNPGQAAAARGFAVFYPNYRASTGRGVEFSKLDHRDPAGKEFDDIVDGVDHLVATGLVDNDRVGITGGSYGGYATAWGATYYSERYAAAVMLYGISDQVSKIGTSDIPNEMVLVHFLLKPWEEWQLFLERSPIFHAHKSRTPTLIAHGEADKRVHPGQSMELYRHLKLRGQAPVRLVTYPGEPHGFRRAASRLDYHLRLLRWFEHYLKGPGGDPPPYQVDYKAATSVTGADETH